jgi:hypothetical protein
VARKKNPLPVGGKPLTPKQKREALRYAMTAPPGFRTQRFREAEAQLSEASKPVRRSLEDARKNITYMARLMDAIKRDPSDMKVGFLAQRVVDTGNQVLEHIAAKQVTAPKKWSKLFLRFYEQAQALVDEAENYTTPLGIGGAVEGAWTPAAPPLRNPRGRKKSMAKNKTRRSSTSAAAMIKRCQTLWTAYCNRPTKANLLKVQAHLDKMAQSDAKTVKAERRRCLRVFNAEWKSKGYKAPAKKKAAKRKTTKRKARKKAPRRRRKNPTALAEFATSIGARVTDTPLTAMYWSSDPAVKVVSQKLEDWNFGVGATEGQIADEIMDWWLAEQVEFQEPVANEYLELEDARAATDLANRIVEWANYAVAYGDVSGAPWLEYWSEADRAPRRRRKNPTAYERKYPAGDWTPDYSKPPSVVKGTMLVLLDRDPTYGAHHVYEKAPKGFRGGLGDTYDGLEVVEVHKNVWMTGYHHPQDEDYGFLWFGPFDTKKDAEVHSEWVDEQGTSIAELLRRDRVLHAGESRRSGAKRNPHGRRRNPYDPSPGTEPDYLGEQRVELDILSTLARGDGTMAKRDMQRLFVPDYVNKTNYPKLIRQLETRGLITRSRTELKITPAGTKEALAYHRDMESRRYRNNPSDVITKRSDFEQLFVRDSLPSVIAREGDTVDKPARKQAWVESLDYAVREGAVSETKAASWATPRKLYTWTIEDSIKAGYEPEGPMENPHGYTPRQAPPPEVLLRRAKEDLAAMKHRDWADRLGADTMAYYGWFERPKKADMLESIKGHIEALEEEVRQANPKGMTKRQHKYGGARERQKAKKRKERGYARKRRKNPLEHDPAMRDDPIRQAFPVRTKFSGVEREWVVADSYSMGDKDWNVILESRDGRLAIRKKGSRVTGTLTGGGTYGSERFGKRKPPKTSMTSRGKTPRDIVDEAIAWSDVEYGKRMIVRGTPAAEGVNMMGYEALIMEPESIRRGQTAQGVGVLAVKINGRWANVHDTGSGYGVRWWMKPHELDEIGVQEWLRNPKGMTKRQHKYGGARERQKAKKRKERGYARKRARKNPTRSHLPRSRATLFRHR